MRIDLLTFRRSGKEAGVKTPRNRSGERADDIADQTGNLFTVDPARHEDQIVVRIDPQDASAGADGFSGQIKTTAPLPTKACLRQALVTFLFNPESAHRKHNL